MRSAPAAVAAATLGCSAVLVLPFALAAWPTHPVTVQAWLSAAALGVLVLTAKNRRIAVLGSMLELGDYSELMHLKTVERARAVCDLLFLYGDEMRPAAREHEHYSTHRALAEALSAAVRPGDTILFKGSRGMHMEEALSMFMEYGQ